VIAAPADFLTGVSSTHDEGCRRRSDVYSRQVRSLSATSRAVGRHAIPLAGAVVLLGVFMGASLWAVPHLRHSSGWLYFGDIWNYFQLAHFTDLGIYQVIYGQTLTTTPGIILVLAPVWAITHAAGMSVAFLFEVPHPTAWLVLGPYEVLLSASALFAADAVAVRLGATRERRLLICAGGVLALYSVVLWGHPEDAVAVAFLLYSCLAASDRRWATSAWLFGAAVAFQPFVLLALAPVFFPAGLRRVPGLVARAAAPAAALLVLPLAGDWSATARSLIVQPAFPAGGRPTPWIHLATPLAHNLYAGAAVAGGPIRLLGIMLSIVIGLWFCRAQQDLGLLISIAALALTFRCVFESVIAPYYVFPTIAFALVSVSVATWPRSVAVSLIAVLVNWGSNFDSHSTWVWWPIVAGLAALLAVSWPKRTAPELQRQSCPENSECSLAGGASVVATSKLAFKPLMPVQAAFLTAG